MNMHTRMGDSEKGKYGKLETNDTEERVDKLAKRIEYYNKK